MKSVRFIGLVSILFLCTSCSFVNHQQESGKLEGLDEGGLSGQVLKPEKIKKGGKLLIIPFLPGEDVLYDDVFETITLKVVSGIAQSARDSQVPFEILFADNAEKAEIIIEGRVVEQLETSRMSSMLGRNKIGLAVRGRMFDNVTGETLAVFTIEKYSNEKNATYPDLGNQLGVELGNFLFFDKKGEEKK